MYFKNFPQTRFLVSPPGYRKNAVYVSAVDITVNIRFIKQLIDNISLYEYYNIQEGETLEIISEKVYDSPHYNWVIMLLNNIYDYRNDFIMSDLAFEKYIIQKYDTKETAQSTVHGYRNDDGIWSTQYSFELEDDTIRKVKKDDAKSNFDFKPVYAYEYEIEQNEKKRRIKLISTDMLAIVLQNFRAAI